MSCKHTTTHVTAGKNGGEYLRCSRCTAIVKVIRVGPARCGEPLPFGGVCTFRKGHDESDIATERLHGVHGGA